MQDSEEPLALSIEDLYGDAWLSGKKTQAILDESLNPRGPDMLFDVAAGLEVGPDRPVLDVGCRDGRHLFELTRRFGCASFGVEPVQANVDRAALLRAGIQEKEPDVASLIHVALGRIEALPFADSTFSLVWARDMLIHVGDLAAGLKECRRVLAPDGHALVYQMFATPWLEPEEARRLWPPLAAVPRNADPEYFEDCVHQAGFTVLSRQEIRSEWREFREESGERTTSRQLLQAARLIRGRDRLMPQLGRPAYESELADHLWGIYQMIGKLSARVYVLE
jgi:SAM-dependent methyltransferase